MSNSIKSAQSAQKKSFNLEFKGFNSCIVAVLSAPRESALVPFFDAAGVPSADSSRSVLIEWGRTNVLPLLPSFWLGGAWVGARFTPRKESAVALLESFDLAKDLRNVAGAGLEIGAATGAAGSLHTAYAFIEYTKKVPVILKTDAENGGAGVVYKVENGARVYTTEITRKYLCDAGGVFAFADVCSAFLSFCGVSAAVAAEEAAALELRAAKEVARAEAARVRADATAADAVAKVAEMKKRAKDKAAAVAEAVAKNGMTTEKAAAVVAADAAKEGAKVAEVAESADVASGENVRKKVSTKKLAQNYVA